MAERIPSTTTGAPPRGVLRPPRTGFSLTRWHPKPELAGFVALFWQVRWDLPRGAVHRQLTLPHPGSHVAIEADAIEVYGPRRTYFEKQLRDRGRVLAVRLRPGALRGLLGTPEADFVDQTRLVRSVLGHEWHAALSVLVGIEDSDDDDAVATFETLLQERLPPVADERITKAEAAVGIQGTNPEVRSCRRPYRSR